MTLFQSPCCSPQMSGGSVPCVHAPPALLLTNTCWSNVTATARVAGVPCLPSPIFTIVFAGLATEFHWRMVVQGAAPVVVISTPTPRCAAYTTAELPESSATSVMSPETSAAQLPPPLVVCHKPVFDATRTRFAFC